MHRKVFPPRMSPIFPLAPAGPANVYSICTIIDVRETHASHLDNGAFHVMIVTMLEVFCKYKAVARIQKTTD